MTDTAWKSCAANPPRKGEYVEITRDGINTDKVWWYPENGNWPVSELSWREAKEEEKK